MAKWRSMDGKFDLQVKTATRHSSGGAARQAPWFVVARSALPLGTGNIGIGNISTLATFFSFMHPRFLALTRDHEHAAHLTRGFVA